MPSRQLADSIVPDALQGLGIEVFNAGHLSSQSPH
jgi:hypothetical protein